MYLTYMVHVSHVHLLQEVRLLRVRGSGRRKQRVLVSHPVRIPLLSLHLKHQGSEGGCIVDVYTVWYLRPRPVVIPVIVIDSPIAPDECLISRGTHRRVFVIVRTCNFVRPFVQ